MGRALKDFAIGLVQYRYVIRAVTTASRRFDEVRVVDARSGQTTRVILARVDAVAFYTVTRHTPASRQIASVPPEAQAVVTPSHSPTRMFSARQRERRVGITKRAPLSNGVRDCCRVLTCSVLASACSDSSITSRRAPVCDPQISPYALIVTVLDSSTGEPIALQTTGTADAPGVHDTLLLFSPGDSARLHSSKNVQGRYRITLNQPGHRTWIAYGVNVVWSQCAGGNVAVVARMQGVTP